MPSASSAQTVCLVLVWLHLCKPGCALLLRSNKYRTVVPDKLHRCLHEPQVNSSEEFWSGTPHALMHAWPSTGCQVATFTFADLTQTSIKNNLSTWEQRTKISFLWILFLNPALSLTCSHVPERASKSPLNSLDCMKTLCYDCNSPDKMPLLCVWIIAIASAILVPAWWKKCWCGTSEMTSSNTSNLVPAENTWECLV